MECGVRFLYAAENFERYGGNTTCIRYTREEANRIAFIDAGTGIRNLGKEIINKWHNAKYNKYCSFPIFIGTIYRDFPFFEPAYNKHQRIGILAMGRERKIKDLKEYFPRKCKKNIFR